MPRRTISLDDRQYGQRSSVEVRTTLLELALDFVLAARAVGGVERIALLGSVLTAKPRPKDVDLLVTINDAVDLDRLARAGRRLKGRAQSMINSGADVFLADARGSYLGRICPYRECHPRVLCQARHCGARPHLADDLDLVHLKADLIASPPLELHPRAIAHADVPEDVERLLLAPLRANAPGNAAAAERRRVSNSSPPSLTAEP